MNYRVCISCGKHVRATESRCWNCSAEFTDAKTATTRNDPPAHAPVSPSAIEMSHAPADGAVGHSATGGDARMRKCPFCAEDIQQSAIKCKHCKSDLTGRVESAKSLPFTPVAGATPTSGILFFLMAFVLVILSVVLLGPFGPFLLVLGTSIWAAVDASTHKLADYQNGLGGPASAFFGSLLLWILVFPWYLAIRSRIRSGVQPVKA